MATYLEDTASQLARDYHEVNMVRDDVQGEHVGWNTCSCRHCIFIDEAYVQARARRDNDDNDGATQLDLPRTC